MRPYPCFRGHAREGVLAVIGIPTRVLTASLATLRKPGASGFQARSFALALRNYRRIKKGGVTKENCGNV